MQKITTFLTFESKAEEAIKFYTSIFKNSKVVSTMSHGGQFFSGTFQLEGQEFIVLNGGPHFKFAQGFSLFVKAETQEEIDDLYEKLSEEGQKQPCGWLLDKFGVSWQVIPPILGKLMNDKDPQKSKRVVDAMLKMHKIDIQKLKDAYDNKE
jgi:predicted 3-demethylubiquinone-9 3-methyltransferase (glyoxalase superfamily)